MIRDALSRRFPQTWAAFSKLNQDPHGVDGEAALSHLLELESGFLAGPLRSHRNPGSEAARAEPYDVVLAGGGLSLLYAAALAQRGVRVLVFDRRRIGCGHREWNISRRELTPLCASGLFDEAALSRLIRLQYRYGICRFAGGPAYPVRDVLDCVVDAEALLAGLRERALRYGATLLDYHELIGYRSEKDSVTVTLARVQPNAPALSPAAATIKLRARLFIDALGARSPHARFDLCCPTVGGVMDGMLLGSAAREMNSEVGEILVTTEGVEDGQQHIWEGFPATGQRMTIYLFYYQRAEAVRAAIAAGAHPLLSLYERFFCTLSRYKSGPLSLWRPAYGYIPAYTRLGPMPAAAGPRVLLVGDAASRHSPLTFCGFGSMIRSFWSISEGLVRLLETERRGKPIKQRDLDELWAQVEPPALNVMGGLSLMMMPPPEGNLEDPDGINALLDAAFASLGELGEDAYAAFLKDSVDASTFIRFMRGAASRHPAVYRKVFSHLSPCEAMIWLARLGRFRFAEIIKAHG